MRGKERSDLEEAIAELAERQHGKLSRRQLLALGLGGRAIEYRLAAGWLRPDLRGVYSLGHRPASRESRWMASVLHAGENSALSHWSAATLLRMRTNAGPLTHVTCPRRRRSKPAIKIHHAQLADDEVTVENGIPTTTPSRTLLDLAPLLPSPTLSRMLAAADAHDGASLRDLLERYPRKPGVPKLRVALAEPSAMTRSDLEARVLAAVRRAGLPEPDVNSVIEGYEVDFAWPEPRVIAEVDSFATHGSRHAFEADRARDRKLAIAGWTVARLTDQSDIEDLSRLLASSAAHSRAAG